MIPNRNDIDLLMAVMADLFDMVTLARKSRKRDYVLARQLAMKVMREKLSMKVTEIGLVFGFHHTTVLHSLNRLDGLLATRDDIACRMWDSVLNDHRLRHLMHETDNRVCILFPKHIPLEAFLAHIRLKYPDIEVD